jgi:hypothetical protein
VDNLYEKQVTSVLPHPRQDSCRAKQFYPKNTLTILLYVVTKE